MWSFGATSDLDRRMTSMGMGDISAEWKWQSGRSYPSIAAGGPAGLKCHRQKVVLRIGICGGCRAATCASFNHTHRHITLNSRLTIVAVIPLVFYLACSVIDFVRRSHTTHLSPHITPISDDEPQRAARWFPHRRRDREAQQPGIMLGHHSRQGLRCHRM